MGDKLGNSDALLKDPDCKQNGMDVDCIPSQALAERSQVKNMEEELESIDLSGLDIFELEQAC